MRPIGIAKVDKPTFEYGREVVRKALARSSKPGKTVGIISASQHHTEMPHSEFKYSSKRFVDEVGEVVSATEMLGTINGARSAVNGAIVSRALISPLAMRNTKLYQRCGLWNRYRFRKIAFEYIPTVASTVGGELTMAVTIDPLENPAWEVANGDGALRRMMGYSNAVTFNSYTHAHVTVHFTPGDDEWYYIGEAADPRFEYMGEFMLQESIMPTGSLPASGWQYGILRLHYEIEFCGATTDVGVSSTTEVVGTCTVNSNATPAVAGQPVLINPVAPGGVQNTLYIPTSLAANAATNGVWACTVLTTPTATVSWQDANDVAVALSPGTCFYIKTTQVNGGYMAFSSVPGIQGDPALDDQLVRWQANTTASATFTARFNLVVLTQDAPV